MILIIMVCLFKYIYYLETCWSLLTKGNTILDEAVRRRCTDLVKQVWNTNYVHIHGLTTITASAISFLVLIRKLVTIVGYEKP